MFTRIIPVFILMMFMAACNATSDEATIPESDSVAVVEATDAPVIEDPTLAPTVEEVVVEPTAEAVAVEPTLVPTIEPTAIPTIEPTPEPPTSIYNAPDWTNLQLVNAATGATFTLADFAGKTVLVEPMATWCGNCRAQQGYIATAMESLNPDEFVFISLSVGENVSNSVLADYAVRNNFPQLFAVATDDLTRALVDNFGFSVTSPPSTPHFIISPIGTVSALTTGFHQADAIIQEVTAAQNS